MRSKNKIPQYQNGQAYLTSHRTCYVDHAEPRKNSVAIFLKDVEKPEFYVGFVDLDAHVKHAITVSNVALRPGSSSLHPKSPFIQSLSVSYPVVFQRPLLRRALRPVHQNDETALHLTLR